MDTPPNDTATGDATSRASRFGARRVRVVAWAVLAAALLGYIAFGSVSAISYTYYAFSGRLVRLSPHRSLVGIWRDAVAELPAFSVDWLPGTMIVACVAVTVACAIAGAWLLLVQAPEVPRRSTRTE